MAHPLEPSLDQQVAIFKAQSVLLQRQIQRMNAEADLRRALGPWSYDGQKWTRQGTQPVEPPDPTTT